MYAADMSTKPPQKKDTPLPRKMLALLTDDEWRALRVAAAERDTTIQGYVTTIILRALQDDDQTRR